MVFGGGGGGDSSLLSTPVAPPRKSRKGPKSTIKKKLLQHGQEEEEEEIESRNSNNIHPFVGEIWVEFLLSTDDKNPHCFSEPRFQHEFQPSYEGVREVSERVCL